MEAGEQVHALLPWYLTSTLDEGETRAFEEHLSGCTACREELEVLRRMKRELDEHGPALLEDHPTAERLVAAVQDELPEAEARRVRRHLALCTACATEARWVRGESVAAGTPAVPDAAAMTAPWVRWVAPLAAAAAVVVLGATFLWRDEGGGRPGAELFTPTFVRPAERASGAATVVASPERGADLTLYFEVDFAPAEFPVTFALAPVDGPPVLTLDSVAAERLVQGQYLFVRCAAASCGPGTYLATLRGRSGDTLEYRVEVPRPPAD